MRCPSPSPCSRLLRTPGVSSKQSRGSVLPGRGTGSAGHLQSRKHRDFADRGTDGQDQWDNQGAFGLWPSCLLEELTQLRSCPLPLLPPPTLHSVKGTGLILPVPCPLLGRAHGETRVLVLAGMEQQERRGPQHLVGKPCAHADPCPQVSPPPSLRPCPPQWPGLWLQPMAAGTRLLCCGRPGSGIRARAAMVGPEPRLPSRHGRSGRAGAGAAPLGLVALGSRGAVRPWAAQWPLSPPPPRGMHGACILLCRWPWGRCHPAGTRGEPSWVVRGGEGMGLAPPVSPSPGALPVVTGYASAMQCPPVLSGCSAAEAAQGTVCEQTSGQSLAAAKESNQRSKGEQRGAGVPRQRRAAPSRRGTHGAAGSPAGGPGSAGQAGTQAEPPCAPCHPCGSPSPQD